MSVRDRAQERRDDSAAARAAALRVFLNYRRDDSSGHAGRLYDDLTDRLSDCDVFMDIDKIDPGADFVDVIETALDRCDVVLTLIGRQWLTMTDERGQRRLDDPDDYVRLELAEALARNMRVIPVRVQGSSMPSSPDLPDELKSLARRQAVELSDTRWHHDVGALVATLEQLSAAARERERMEQERLRLEEEQREAEKARLAQTESERQRSERAQAERERRERERAEHEEAKRSKAERDRAERDRKALERAEQHEAKRRLATEEQEKRSRVASERSEQTRARLSALATSARRPLVIVAAAAVMVLGLAAVAAFAFGGGGGGKTDSAAPVQGSREAAILGTPQSGKTLTVRNGMWRGSPTGFSYQWRRCNKAGGGCAVIRGARSRSYRLDAKDVGRRIRAFVVARNAEGSGTAVTAPTATVAAALVRPSNSTRPKISGLARDGSVLQATSGRWRGTRPISVRRTWLRCHGTDCAPIEGVQGRSYRLQAADVGHSIRIEERAASAAGRGVARSIPTAVVAAQPAPQETTPQPTEPEPTQPPPFETVPPPVDP